MINLKILITRLLQGKSTISFLAAVCISLIVGPLALSAQWVKLISFDSSRIRDVWFQSSGCSPEMGFLSVQHITDGQALQADLLRTSDGGLSWKSVLSNQFAIASIAFKNNTTGWAASSFDGPIYQTVDGGFTWTPITLTGTFWSIAYSSESDLLFASEFNRIYVSGDEGTTWSIMRAEPHYSFSFSTPSNGISSGVWGSPMIFTTDGGVSWDLNTLQGEEFQPLGISGTHTFFAASEQGPNANSFMRSDDGAASWTTIYQFPGSDTLTGMVAGDLCHLYLQTSTGMISSYDEGLSWSSIGGPGNTKDYRFWTNGSTIYAAGFYDSFGSVSLLKLVQPKSKAELTPSVLRFFECSPTDTTLWFSISGSCYNSILNSLGILGSQAFQLVKSPVLPDTLPTNESAIIRYTPNVNTLDTAILLMSICTPTGVVDTSVLLLGKGQTFIHFSSSVSSARANAGGEFTLKVLPDRIEQNEGLSTIDFDVSFNDDLLEELNATTSIPGATLISSSGTVLNGVRTIPIHISGNNLSFDPTQAVLSVSFKALLADSSSCPITLNNLKLNGGDVSYRCLLDADISSTRFNLNLLCGDSTIQQFLRQGNLNFEVQSIVPNPTDGKLTVTLSGNGPVWVVWDLYDLLGERVMSGILAGSANSLDVAALGSGSYYLRMSSSGEVVSRRVVVRR